MFYVWIYKMVIIWFGSLYLEWNYRFRILFGISLFIYRLKWLVVGKCKNDIDGVKGYEDGKYSFFCFWIYGCDILYISYFLYIILIELI